MVDYLEIKLENQNGIKVFIGFQKNFDNACFGYEIMNFDVIPNDTVKLSIDDFTLVKNLDLLSKSIYDYYNETNPKKLALIEHFQNGTFNNLVKNILKRLPFLQEFKITNVEYGYNLENFVTRSEIELITNRLFNNYRIDKSSYAYYTSTEKNINSQSTCYHFSLNIAFNNQI